MNTEANAASVTAHSTLRRDTLGLRGSVVTKRAQRRLAVSHATGGIGPRGGLFARGQAMVGIQFALIGDCALAVTQLSYVGARYASVHPTYQLTSSSGGSDVESYMLSVASPTIMSNSGNDLTISMPTPCPTTNSFSNPVTISVQYNLTSKIFLPNPFLGISFPTTVQSTQTAFCEGGAS
jgi:hypothetical protein